MKEFSEILKDLRKKKGISQEALGIIVHVSRSAIAKYENGLGLPSEEVIKALCNYFEVDREYLFPKSNVEQIIVLKNRKIKKQKIIISCSLILTFIIVIVSVIGALGGFTPARSGHMLIIDAGSLVDAPLENDKFFNVGEYKFGYNNVFKNEDEEFVLEPGGQLWSVNGIPDYLMGYYNGENTSLYVYKNGLENIKIEETGVTSNDKYCFNVAEFKYAYNFVIVNDSNEQVIIKQLEFWC